MARRRKSGTASRSNSSRLLAVSGNRSDKPVTLPPGRARLATRPLPTGSPTATATIGIVDVACFAASCCLSSLREDGSYLEPNELRGDFAVALIASFRPAVLDRDGTTLDPAEFVQSLHKSSNPLAHGPSGTHAQEADGRQFSRLLRPRANRPCRRCAAESQDELAPPHVEHGASRALGDRNRGAAQPAQGDHITSAWG